MLLWGEIMGTPHKRKLLITGGYGFLGAQLAACFSKEGYDVFVIDDGSSGQPAISLEHCRCHTMQVTDTACEELFRLNNFDYVIHMAERSTAVTDDNYLNNAETNFLGLANMMMLSSRYNVRRFYLASTGSVFGDVTGIIKEPTNAEADVIVGAKPGTLRAVSKRTLEYYALGWKKVYNLPITILRFSTIYGPGEKVSHGVVPELIQHILEKHSAPVVDTVGQTRDFLYVSDAAYAVFRAVNQEFDGEVLHVSSGRPVTYEHVLELLEPCTGKIPAGTETLRYPRFQRVTLDNTACRTVLGCEEKMPLGQGLKQTYEWYKQKEYSAAVEQQEKKRKAWRKRIIAMVRPYAENVLLFFVMAFIMLHQKGSVVNTVIGMDFNYVYIAAMGILYGKRQSIPAVVASSVLLIYSFLSNGADLVALLYLPQHLLHFASYLFVGVLTGYIADSKDRTIAQEKYERNRVEDEYAFLRKVYLESVALKNRFYHQIVNSDDSIGRIYDIVRELDSINVEEIYTRAAQVTSEIMNASKVAVYSVSANGAFLRQKVYLGERDADQPYSLMIEDRLYLQQLIARKEVFVNRGLRKDFPDMAAPVLYGDRVIAVIEIRDMDFAKWTLYHRNLLAVTARLISMSMGKAYRYEEEIQGKKYIAGTHILKEADFDEVLAVMQQRQEAAQESAGNILLEIDGKEDDAEKLDRKLAGVARMEDFAGIYHGRYYILLVGVRQKSLEAIEKRFVNAGVHVKLVGDANV